MRLDNLLSLRYKPFVPRTTDSAHGYEIVCDIRRARLCSLRRIMSGSRTWPTCPGSGAAEEFVYLAVVVDAFSRKVVGWALRRIHLQASLPLGGARGHQPARGGSLKDLIHHSNRGVRCACRRLRLAAEPDRRPTPGIQPPGNTTRQHKPSFMPFARSRGGRRQGLSQPRRREQDGQLIDDVYDARRLHSSIGYKPPIEFEHEFGQSSETCQQTNHARVAEL